MLVGVIIALFGLQADIASKHRIMTQDVLYRLKKLDLENRNNKGKSDRSSVYLVRESAKSSASLDEVLKE